MNKKTVVTLYLKTDLIDSARFYARNKGITVSGTVNLALGSFLSKEND